MPGENEIIASVTAAQENSAFDVTQFVESTEETSDIVTVIVQVYNSISTSSVADVSIEVNKATLNDEGLLNPELINKLDMSKIIDEHDICYIKETERWVVGTDFVYCEYDSFWLHSHDSIYGINPDGEEDYFSNQDDYVRCSDTNTV
jgi:hypothetical protein